MRQKNQVNDADNRQFGVSQVFVLYTYVDDISLDAWQPELPPALDARFARMTNSQARAASLGGLYLLEQAARLGGFGPVDFATLGRDPHGRPVLPGGPAFSISHSRDRVVCAVANHACVGADVERLRKVDTQRMARFLKDPAAGADTAAFFAAWTAREAVVKATGKVGLHRIAGVELGDGEARIDGRSLYLTYPTIDADHCLCIATDRPDAQIRLIAN